MFKISKNLTIYCITLIFLGIGNYAFSKNEILNTNPLKEYYIGTWENLYNKNAKLEIIENTQNIIAKVKIIDSVIKNTNYIFECKYFNNNFLVCKNGIKNEIEYSEKHFDLIQKTSKKIYKTVIIQPKSISDNTLKIKYKDLSKYTFSKCNED